MTPVRTPRRRRPFALATVGALALAAAFAAAHADTPAPAPASAPASEPKGPPPLPAPLTVSSRPDAGPGERLFLEKCAMCHGPNGMGTGLLARRSDEPLLEKRTDLTADFVIQAARMGIGNMPAIPRGEASDAQLAAIAHYLAHDAAPTSRKARR
ncbi:cytochrome c [Novosphingobium sp. 1949]|uniref:Cytochrome c n=1 Tax=Novosphingobium organovorum TaxID=2930092 RepID=A0ABT0B9S3_9SPHN|nr:cytochrome c [Novosphingobium organovorum]MCJ2181807.1 cytochrome c [Novosphingobium organovorum]